MKVVPFVYNCTDDLIANCYVVSDEKNNCLVIDPSMNSDGIVNYLRKNNLTCLGILLTHAHFDHMGGVDRLVEAFHIPMFVGREDEIGLTDSEYNCSSLCEKEMSIKSQATILEDGEVITLLSEEVEAISTPFHTRGALCFYFKKSKWLFSGDSLFKGSIGRSDLSSSIARKTRESLEKIFSLPDDVYVYPGHGPQTTIGFERKLNPFIK